MSLDLTKVASQVGGMVARLKADGEERRKRLNYALDVLCNRVTDLDYLKRKIASSKTTWLVAGLADGLDQRSEAEEKRKVAAERIKLAKSDLLLRTGLATQVAGAAPGEAERVIAEVDKAAEQKRIAILETKVTGMQRILWVLVSATLAQVGVQIV